MKKSTLALIVVGILSAFHMAGCSKSDDGPSLSDDDLLKRGSAGRNSSMQNSKTPPSTTATTAGGK